MATLAVIVVVDILLMVTKGAAKMIILEALDVITTRLVVVVDMMLLVAKSTVKVVI